jgi:hypothetical protein
MELTAQRRTTTDGKPFYIGRGAVPADTVDSSPRTAVVRHGRPGAELVKHAKNSSQYGVLDLTTDRMAARYIDWVKNQRIQLERRFARAHMLGYASNVGGVPSAAASQQGQYSNPASTASSSTGPIPFDQASKRGTEQGPTWTFTPGVGQTQLGPIGLPANGYLRQVELDIRTVTASTGGTPVLQQDSPANILQSIVLQDTNSNQLDLLPGYALLQDNCFGGYAGAPDPRVDPDYSASATAPSLQLMLVRELAPTGFGALANMSASQQFKFSAFAASQAQMYSTAPSTTYPTLSVTVWMHYWTLPDATDEDNVPQDQAPPYEGTAQYRWYSPANTVTQNFNLSLTQVGNSIRNLILIARNATPVRDNGVYPDPLYFRWNADILHIIGQRQLRKIARELTNDLTALDTGVLPLPYNFGQGRFVGGSGVNSWLPTFTSTRLQVFGSQPTSDPGTVDVFTNDVSVAETNPALRPVQGAGGGIPTPIAPVYANTP